MKLPKQVSKKETAPYHDVVVVLCLCENICSWCGEGSSGGKFHLVGELTSKPSVDVCVAYISRPHKARQQQRLQHCSNNKFETWRSWHASIMVKQLYSMPHFFVKEIRTPRADPWTQFLVKRNNVVKPDNFRNRTSAVVRAPLQLASAALKLNIV